MTRHKNRSPIAECVCLIVLSYPHINSLLSYWTMHFDASPDNQRGLFRLLKKDPAVVRASMLKMGENLRGVSSGPERTIAPLNPVPKAPLAKQRL